MTNIARFTLTIDSESQYEKYMQAFDVIERLIKNITFEMQQEMIDYHFAREIPICAEVTSKMFPLLFKNSSSEEIQKYRRQVLADQEDFHRRMLYQRPFISIGGDENKWIIMKAELTGELHRSFDTLPQRFTLNLGKPLPMPMFLIAAVINIFSHYLRRSLQIDSETLVYDKDFAIGKKIAEYALGGIKIISPDRESSQFKSEAEDALSQMPQFKNLLEQLGQTPYLPNKPKRVIATTETTETTATTETEAEIVPISSSASFFRRETRAQSRKRTAEQAEISREQEEGAPATKMVHGGKAV